MVFIPEKEFCRSIEPTYFTGTDYVNFDSIESTVLEEFGVETDTAREELLRLMDSLRDLEGEAFYETLCEGLAGCGSLVAASTIRVLAFLSSIPIGENVLPLVLDDGEVRIYDFKLLRRGQLIDSNEILLSFCSLLKALHVDKLVGRPDFNLVSSLMATKVGTEGNKRKNRSGKLMDERCKQVLGNFVKTNRFRWREISYLAESDEGRILLSDAVDIVQVGELLTSIQDSGQREIIKRELSKSIDGLISVRTQSSGLKVACEFNAYFSSSGSKPSEIRRAYGYVSDHLPKGVALLWVTDGRIYLSRDMNALNSLGKALVEFNHDRTNVMVTTPKLIPEYLPSFIEANLVRME